MDEHFAKMIAKMNKITLAYQARIRALEQLVGRQTLEIEQLQQQLRQYQEEINGLLAALEWDVEALTYTVQKRKRK